MSLKKKYKITSFPAAYLFLSNYKDVYMPIRCQKDREMIKDIEMTIDKFDIDSYYQK